MDANLKAKWVAALRSGKYAQTFGALRLKSEFCCLGVLADCAGATWVDDYEPMLAGKWIQPEATAWLLDGFAGLSHAQQAELARMNDDGKSFLEIADYIEANIPATEVVS